MATTPGLNITEFVTGQNNPDTTINLLLNILEAGACRTLTHDMASDADYTLGTTGTAPFEWQFGNINITDTGTNLTTTRNIIVPVYTRSYYFVNNTLQSLVLKTAAGTGITVAAGNAALLDCDGTNVDRIHTDQP